jgi:ribonucleotide reductase alpha subunit
VNKLIFETIYHAALERSNEIAISRKDDITALIDINKYDDKYRIDVFETTEKDCRTYKCNLNEKTNEIINRVKPIRAELDITDKNVLGSYSSFVGSPASKGILQFDMWNVTPSERYDWATLKKSIQAHGIRNSLLLAPMPTASTSQILGNNECFEPYTSNIYTRRTLAGDYVLANKHLMKELVELGLWTEDLKNNIILNKGSVQHIDGIPDNIKEKYKIVWEIPMKHLIDMSVDRGAFICQSQSLNLWQEDPSYKSLTAMHFYGWKKGLKTGLYYLRRKPRHQPQQFTIDPTKIQQDEEVCETCSA